MRRIIRIAWNFLGRLLHVLHLQNVIVIEAEKGTRENTRAVFNEMMKRGWNTKWHFVLVSEKPEELLPMKHSRTTVIKRANYQDNGLIKKDIAGIVCVQP